MKQKEYPIRFCLIVSTFLVLLNGPFMKAQPTPAVKKEHFGKTAAGRAVDIYTLANSKGAEAKITNYGGRLVSLKMPDKTGKFDDIVLGYDDLAAYENDRFYFGSVIGRYANRIAGGKFSLGGKEYLLSANNGPNHLHGGVRGFDTKIWSAKASAGRGGPRLELVYQSPDGEENYPGALSVTVVYTLTESDELKIEYSAATDKDTVLNLTNHTYFNLAGAGAGAILGHILQIGADRFTPTDASAVPTGELRSVANTPFDFTRPARIGDLIEADDEQLKIGTGYDHNFVLNKKANALALAAAAFEPESGRRLEVWTTEPGIQFYTGNFLDGVKGKNGKIYAFRGGFCLETQHFPDSPNKPDFPSTVLKKGDKFASTTIYRFSVR